MANVYLNSSGRQLTIDPSFGPKKGGEGAVWKVANPKAYPFDTLVKVYHSPPDAEKKAKIKAMLSITPEQRNKLLEFVAWPIDAAFDVSSKKLIGIVIPFAGHHVDIHKLYNPRDRRQHFPQADWTFLGFTAMNVARAFSEVHRLGHIAGDINHGNILVGQDAKVVLIDTDSYQITKAGRSFPCEVGYGEFLPPELFNQKLKHVHRNQNNDNFSIAVIIFMLLFNGRHPFSGQDLGDSVLSLDQAVESCRFAFSNSAKANGVAPPDPTSALQLDDIPTEIAQLFEKAFSKGSKASGRPTAAQWAAALQHHFLGRLKVCAANDKHHHVPGKACPWCRMEQHRSRPFFGVASTQKAATKTTVSPAAKPTPAAPKRTRPASSKAQLSTRRRRSRSTTPQFTEGELASFKGTIGRRTYFLRQLVIFVAIVISVLVEELPISPALFLAPIAIITWLDLSCTAQRLRSIRWPAWLCVICLIPIANLLLKLLLFAWPRKQ